MKLRQVPLEQCHVPKVRVTAVYDEEQAALLRSSLEAMGTVQPIVVIQNADGYEVVDGLHRVEEARRRGETTISAVIREGTATEALLQNLVLNRVRGKVKASEMVAVIGSLWKDHGLASDQIGEKTGLGRDYIEKLQTISQASQGVREMLDREIIGVGHAYEVARLPTHIQQDEVCAKYQVYRFTVKELHGFVEDVLKAMAEIKEGEKVAVPAAPLAPPKYYCEGCKKEVEPRYLRPVQVCPDCFGEVWKLARMRETATLSAPAKAPPA